MGKYVAFVLYSTCALRIPSLAIHLLGIAANGCLPIMARYFVPYYQRPRDTVNTVRLGTMSLGVGLFHDLAYRWIHQLRLGLAVRVRLCTGTLKSTVYCRAERPYYLFMIREGVSDMLRSTLTCCFPLRLETLQVLCQQCRIS